MNVIINNFPEKAYNILRDILIRGREIKIIKMKDIRDIVESKERGSRIKKKTGGRIRLLISLLQSHPLEAIVVWCIKK